MLTRLQRLEAFLSGYAGFESSYASDAAWRGKYDTFKQALREFWQSEGLRCDW